MKRTFTIDRSPALPTNERPEYYYGYNPIGASITEKTGVGIVVDNKIVYVNMIRNIERCEDWSCLKYEGQGECLETYLSRGINETN